MAAEFCSLRVARVDRLTSDSVAVTFEVPNAERERFAFRPGQALTIRKVVDGRDERRSYSICAPLGAPLRIAVREVDGGLISGWLVRHVRPGDVVEVLPPSGAFVLTSGHTGGRHVLVAAGSGITPMMSIAATVLGDPAGEVTLVYANRRSDTVMFADELADLKDRYPARFQLLHVLSREPREADLLSGRLDEARFAAILAGLVAVEEVDHWWLCGPHPMVETARAVLLARGVPVASVHRELFYVEDVPPELAAHADPLPAGATADVTVILDGRVTALALPKDEPILDAAQRVRADLPFACKGGVCGTCRARVTHGEVRMRRNFALEDDEVADGFVLTCQSLPVTDTVTVDFDG
jgi:ring-1,2-phenylacetyl-CoA epoxidase subunit PaaE